MKQLIIETKLLRIRNLKATDLAAFYFYRANPDVTKYQGFDVYTMEEAKEFIQGQCSKEFGKAGEWVQYGIENRMTGELIGDCAIKLHQCDIRIAAIGITVSHTQQKKGYAKESVTALLNFLFGIKDFHRVTATVDTENTASIQLLKSVGFKQEGHFIENIHFKRKWGSEYQFAMLKKEWEVVPNKKVKKQSTVDLDLTMLWL